MAKRFENYKEFEKVIDNILESRPDISFCNQKYIKIGLATLFDESYKLLPIVMGWHTKPDKLLIGQEVMEGIILPRKIIILSYKFQLVFEDTGIHSPYMTIEVKEKNNSYITLVDYTGENRLEEE